MGGLIRSIEMSQLANKYNIPLIIGSQVGESSILTRAAIAIANEYRTNLIAQEGAYGTLLLELDVTDKPIMFGKEGKLKVDNYLDTRIYGLEINYLSNYL